MCAQTPDDRRELQRQRRLVKNRESAQLSRQRKKGYIGQLELRLTDLSVAHDALKAKVILFVVVVGRRLFPL